ncbi:MAG: hypothetical protein SGARI_007281 [Bacillariaceae sp.]
MGLLKLRLLWIAVALAVATATAAAEDVLAEESCSSAAEATCQDEQYANTTDDNNDTASDDEGLDKAEHECQDTHKQCSYWLSVGECSDNKEFMESKCPRSCRLCPDQLEEDLETGADMGVPQKLWSNKFDVDEDQTEEVILAAREYMANGMQKL